MREVVNTRRSCKRFQRDSVIPPDVLEDILCQTLVRTETHSSFCRQAPYHCLALQPLSQRSPSGFNLQPYTIVMVQSEEAKAAVADACLGPNAWRVQDAAVTAVFAADLESLRRVDAVVQMERSSGAHEGYLASLPMNAAAFASGPLPRIASLVRSTLIRAASALTPMPTPQSPTAWAYKQTAMAATTMLLAATAHGLATCPMEGFDGDRIARALDIPSRYDVPLIISMGQAHAEDPSQARRSPRFALPDMVRADTFGQPWEAR